MPIPTTLPSIWEPTIENHLEIFLVVILSTSKCWTKNIVNSTVPTQVPNRGGSRANKTPTREAIPLPPCLNLKKIE